jgi:AcrR family transcriptional regulator
MTSIRHKASESASATTADDAYLDAARDAILAVGWSRTTLTDIARRAGVSRMTLYRRWPDTQTMLADLMTREWGHVVEQAGAAAPEHADTLDRIARGVVGTVRSLRANPLLRRIVDVDPEVLLPYLLDRRGRSQQMVADALAELVERGQRDGSVRQGDPMALARSLILACHGFTLSAHTMVDGPRGTQSATPGGTPDRDADVTHLDDQLDELVRRFLQP